MLRVFVCCDFFLLSIKFHPSKQSMRTSIRKFKASSEDKSVPWIIIDLENTLMPPNRPSIRTTSKRIHSATHCSSARWHAYNEIYACNSTNLTIGVTSNYHQTDHHLLLKSDLQRIFELSISIVCFHKKISPQSKGF